MILLVLLSIGVIYALIPIIVIVILIIAARGAGRGEDFFEIFGVQTFMNSFRGIQSSGAGKGIKGAYKSNTKAVKGAIGEKREQGGGLYGNWFGLEARNAKIPVSELRNKMDALSGLTKDQLLSLSKYYGLGAGINSSAGTLVEIAIANLSLNQINDFLNEKKLKPGNINPLKPPTGTVNMSIKSPSTIVGKAKDVGRKTGEFYRDYYNARASNARFTKPPMFRASAEDRAKGIAVESSGIAAMREDMLRNMPEDDLKGLFKYYGIKNVPEGSDKDALVKQANSTLTSTQIATYLNQKAGSEKPTFKVKKGEKEVYSNKKSEKSDKESESK